MCPLAISAQAVGQLEAINRAMGLVEQGEYVGARQTLADVPNGETDALALTARGAVEVAAGKYADAEPLFRAAIAKDPQLFAAPWGLTLCLLKQSRAYEAAMYIDRASSLAPDVMPIKALQAYVQLLLGQTGDAAKNGKLALDGGDRSPFLMATLAQIHYHMGYLSKAVEFGSFSAKYLYGADLRGASDKLVLPLSMTITDTPRALAPATPAQTETPQPATPQDLAIQPPTTDTAPTVELPRFQIVSPANGAQICGVQRVQAIYRSRRAISFVTFLVDDQLRGMVTEFPYHFSWDADSMQPGEHRLTVRAYDNQGLAFDEDTITVITTSAKINAGALASSAEVMAAEKRMVAVTQPTPSPLSLFMTLGQWHLLLKEPPQAIGALEKAVAIDPTDSGTLLTLQKLYQDNGLHSISTTGEVVRGPATGLKRVALTFDDGPNPLYTPGIMAELNRYGAHATFFLVGKMVQQYPNLAMDLLANGHELANHTYNHPNLTRLQPREVVQEVLLCRALIKDVTGRDTYLFRPPGGNIDAAVTRELRNLDYNIIYWSINAGEYHNYPPAEQAALILSRVQDGSVILLHNGPVDGTLNILPTLLAELKRRGYTCVTVSELMKNAGTN